MAAVAGILLVGVVGWRGLIVLGGALGVVLVPLLHRLLPREKRPTSTAGRSGARPIAELFRRDLVRSTAAFGVASFKPAAGDDPTRETATTDPGDSPPLVDGCRRARRSSSAAGAPGFGA